MPHRHLFWKIGHKPILCGSQIFRVVKVLKIPRSLITNSVSQAPLKGVRNEAGCLLGIAEPGKGRVVCVTDAGWISNSVLRADRGSSQREPSSRNCFSGQREPSRWPGAIGGFYYRLES